MHESAPTEHLGIADAAIEVADGSGETRIIRSDQSGRFSITVFPGDVTLRVAAPRFTSQEHTIRAIGETDLSIPLLPVFEFVRSELSLPCCLPRDQGISEVIHSFVVHHAGAIGPVYAGATDYGGSASSTVFFCADLIDQRGTVLATGQGLYDFGTYFASVPVSGGQHYSVKLYQCRFQPNRPHGISGYRISVVHPS